MLDIFNEKRNNNLLQFKNLHLRTDHKKNDWTQIHIQILWSTDHFWCFLPYWIGEWDRVYESIAYFSLITVIVGVIIFIITMIIIVENGVYRCIDLSLFGQKGCGWRGLRWGLWRWPEVLKLRFHTIFALAPFTSPMNCRKRCYKDEWDTEHIHKCSQKQFPTIHWVWLWCRHWASFLSRWMSWPWGHGRNF